MMIKDQHFVVTCGLVLDVNKRVIWLIVALRISLWEQIWVKHSVSLSVLVVVGKDIDDGSVL